MNIVVRWKWFYLLSKQNIVKWRKKLFVDSIIIVCFLKNRLGMEHIIISCFLWWLKVSFQGKISRKILQNFLVANQFWYVYCLYYMAWPPAGMEVALAIFCCFGFCSGSFLIAIQLRCILKRGTQYFPGKSPARKVVFDIES